MSEQGKIIYMGRGGTPYMRVPDRIKPEEACIASVKEIIKATMSMDRASDVIDRLKARIKELEAIVDKQADNLHALVRDDQAEEASKR